MGRFNRNPFHRPSIPAIASSMAVGNPIPLILNKPLPGVNDALYGGTAWFGHNGSGSSIVTDNNGSPHDPASPAIPGLNPLTGAVDPGVSGDLGSIQNHPDHAVIDESQAMGLNLLKLGGLSSGRDSTLGPTAPVGLRALQIGTARPNDSRKPFGLSGLQLPTP